MTSFLKLILSGIPDVGLIFMTFEDFVIVPILSITKYTPFGKPLFPKVKECEPIGKTLSLIITSTVSPKILNTNNELLYCCDKLKWILEESMKGLG